jgi:triosephosphate isomerase
MRRPFIAGNWKMNLLPDAARELAIEVRRMAERHPDVDVAVAPVANCLPAVIEALAGSRVGVAGQNCHWEISGAFTGEIAPEMLRATGCSHVLIGHSERRQYFGEKDETVNKKVLAAFRAGLKPIVCIGETLEERQKDETVAVVSRQLKGALRDIAAGHMNELTLAYEPVWAIGTGHTATPEQAQAVHATLRKLLAELYDGSTAEVVRIQYGGSVKPDNVDALMAQADIDGALVGGASLKAESFEALIGIKNA